MKSYVLEIKVSEDFVEDERGLFFIQETLLYARKDYQLKTFSLRKRKKMKPLLTRLERDLDAIKEVLGWDPRGDGSEYSVLDRAQAAYKRLESALLSKREEVLGWYLENLSPLNEILRIKINVIDSVILSNEEKTYFECFVEDAIELERMYSPSVPPQRPVTLLERDLAVIQKVLNWYDSGHDEEIYFSARAINCLYRLKKIIQKPLLEAVSPRV